MSQKVKAKYTNGTLVLEEPLAITEGEQVEVLVLEQHGSKSSARKVANILAKIAALPLEGKTDRFSGRDHDKILYGTPNKK